MKSVKELLKEKKSVKEILKQVLDEREQAKTIGVPKKKPGGKKK